MALWREVRKIDVHTHILLHERPDTCLRPNPPEEMERQHVERVVVLPVFDPRPGSRDDSARDPNARQLALARQFPDRFTCFAETLHDLHPAQSAAELVELLETTPLMGAKLHPTTGVVAHDWSLIPLYRARADAGKPVLIHSNPSDNDPHFDDSSPTRIARVCAVLPDLKVVVGHMGGSRFMDCLGLQQHGWFELSGGLQIAADVLGI